MSQSSTDTKSADLTRHQQSPFGARLRQLNQMLRQGISWSGSERNCLFLNTRAGTGEQPTFANISAVSGVDFLDDGRGLALVDWDHDGDLDAWSSNRTSPQVRFVRNDTASGHHFLKIKLRGGTCNRDGIGARVELYLKDESNTPLIRTLRAGEGYLSQSSKWLHFGLGDCSDVDRLVVRWPGSMPDEFFNLLADANYVITQGSRKASVWSRSRAVAELADRHGKEALEIDSSIQTLLTARPHLPPLSYQAQNRDEAIIVGPRDQPLLINLWASWCQPCLKELAEFSQRQDALKQAGLDLVAVSVEGLDQQGAAVLKDATAVLDRLGFPFASGTATNQLVDTLQLVVDRLFFLQRPLTLPCAFLVDKQGRLAAVYRGGVSVDRLLADAGKLELDGRDLFRAALPFPGRWVVGSRNYPRNFEVGLANDLIATDHADTAMKYVSQLSGPRAIEKDDLAVLLSLIASRMAEQSRIPAAIERLREAIHLDPEFVPARINLGTLLRKTGKLPSAISQLRQAADLQPDLAAAHLQLGIALSRDGQMAKALERLGNAVRLDPESGLAQVELGRALDVTGRSEEAAGHFRTAMRLNSGDSLAPYYLAQSLERAGKHDEAIRNYRRAIRVAPSFHQAHGRLAVLLERSGQITKAIRHYREALKANLLEYERDDELLRLLLVVRNNLAWLLATDADDANRNGVEAVRLMKEALQTLKEKKTSASMLDTLAAAHAECGNFDLAVKVAKRAIKLAASTSQSELAAKIQRRLETYSQNRPVRSH